MPFEYSRYLAINSSEQKLLFKP